MTLRDGLLYFRNFRVRDCELNDLLRASARRGAHSQCEGQEREQEGADANSAHSGPRFLPVVTGVEHVASINWIVIS